MKKTPPPKLYKYQPCNIQTLDNIKNRVIWFSKPPEFNDPFDCARGFRFSELSNKDLKALYRNYWRKTSSKSELERKYTKDGKPNKRFKDDVIVGARRGTEEIVNKVRDEFGVACFSEDVDNLLMWAHYADGHKGFCLEFDTEQLPFDIKEKVLKVEYSDELPEINPIDVVLGKIPNHLDTFTMLLRIKSKSWSYEKEWRLIHTKGHTKYRVGVEALSGIYFGAEMPVTHKEIISLILSGSPTKLYEMQKVEGEFKVAFRPLEYTPHSQAIGKGDLP